MPYQAPRGTADILPDDINRWQHVEHVFGALAASYGYREIRTPIFEDRDLFIRTSGETSDIVTKEMYEFVDKGGRNLALRPEGTASVMRAVIEHGLCPQGVIQRLFYFVSFFRYNRPGRGRLRQAHQAGIELIGATGVQADAEVIEIAATAAKSLGVADLVTTINSIGRSEARAKYREVILSHVESWLRDQTTEAQDKARKNPLGLLDSKDEDAKKALVGVPSILEFLEDESKARFDKLQQLLTDAGVSYIVDPMVVRGLDYYTETVFEGVSPSLEGLSIFGGGRYDNLIKAIGGSATPSVGFGMGIERILLAMEANGLQVSAYKPDVFAIAATPDAETTVLRLAREFRGAGLKVTTDPDVRSLKSQLRQADRSGAEYALIVGSDELSKGTVQIRSLATSDQTEVQIEQALREVTSSKVGA